MACNLLHDDSLMTAVQLFTFIRHRYPDLSAYFQRDLDLVIIPDLEGSEETLQSIRELALRKGLNCSEVCAAWPELIDSEILARADTANFLVIAEIRGKYSQPR